MGAEAFCIVTENTDARKAFNALVEEAREEYGNRSYNGTISTCSMGRCAKTYNQFSEETLNDARKFVEDCEYGHKWVAQYIDLGVCGYETVEIKRHSRKSDAKFKMGYVLYDEDGKRRGDANTKGEAEGKAMKLAYENNMTITIKKEHRRISGNSVVCEVSLKRTFSEKRPRLTRAPGKEIVPIHKYMFYGWASC